MIKFEGRQLSEYRSPAGIALTAVVFLAAILALTAMVVAQNYRASTEAGDERAKASAHVVAAHVQWIMEASDQALRRIDTAIGDRPIDTAPSTVEDINDAVGGLPPGFQYSVFDNQGRLKLTDANSGVGIDVSDRDYFAKLRDGADFVISPLLRERIHNTAVFVIGRSIRRDGHFVGIATIAIPVAKMADFWSSMSLGPNSTVGVIGSDGWLVARYPQLPEAIDLKATPLFKTYLPRSPSGFYDNDISPADGKPRIVGYWKVEGWPLVATAGIDLDEVMEPFWAGVKSELVFGFPILLMLAAGVWWIATLMHAISVRNARLEQAAKANDYLVREIYHRVKNNLQAVMSLIRLQPLPAAAKADMEGRIAAMVAVHEQIYGSDQLGTVEIAPYALKLLEGIAAGYGASVEIVTDLRPLSVDSDRALPIGMIFNEVVTNAYKYAFAGRDGRLSVTLTDDGDGRATMTISDDGPGMDPDATRTGMGSKLIKGLVAQIRGTYAYSCDGGTVFTMTFPLA